MRKRVRRGDLPNARIRSSAKNLFLSKMDAEAPGRFISSPWKYAASGPVPSAWLHTAAYRYLRFQLGSVPTGN
jgi:hypothetical protein